MTERTLDATEGSTCPFGYGAGGTAASAPIYAHAAIAPALSRDKLPTLVSAPIEKGAGGLQTGRCLCGAVSYRLTKPVSRILADHDPDARRWSGGIALTLMVRAAACEFYGWGGIVHFTHSERETKGFCRTCGTSLFVRHRQPAAMDGMLSIMAGTLDDYAGTALAGETCIDDKPEQWALEGQETRRLMTRAEVETLYQAKAGPGR